jgi:hypothetical protein
MAIPCIRPCVRKSSGIPCHRFHHLPNQPTQRHERGRVNSNSRGGYQQRQLLPQNTRHGRTCCNAEGQPNTSWKALSWVPFQQL